VNYSVGSKFCIDEIITIVRPVVYLIAIMKFGRESYLPIKISFVLDIV
jgi:Peroxisomal membrane protein (Pex16)